MDRSKKRQVYAFIDNQNLNMTIQNLGWKIDWIKFRKFLTQKYGVTKAFMFIGYVPEFQDMYEFLHEAGYAIVLKPTFDITRAQPESAEKKDTEEKKPIKGNVDAELVLWAVKEMKNYDRAVIVSGDGDFYTLVEYLEREGKLLKLLSPSGQYSSLYNQFEKHIDRVDHYRKELSYRPNRKVQNN